MRGAKTLAHGGGQAEAFAAMSHSDIVFQHWLFGSSIAPRRTAVTRVPRPGDMIGYLVESLRAHRQAHKKKKKKKEKKKANNNKKKQKKRQTLRPRLAPGFIVFRGTIPRPFMVCLAAFDGRVSARATVDRFATCIHYGGVGLGCFGLDTLSSSCALSSPQVLPWRVWPAALGFRACYIALG